MPSLRHVPTLYRYARLWRNLHGAFTVRCHFKSAWAVRKEEIKTALSALLGGALGWRNSLNVCAVLQKFYLFSACVVYKVFNSIIGVIALDRGGFRLGPRPLWIAWISSNIVAKLWHTNQQTIEQSDSTPARLCCVYEHPPHSYPLLSSTGT